jgi:transcriptional regulator with XRE-family HTH domain
MKEKQVNYKLRSAREQKHWSMEAAAAAVGVAKTTYLRWENGEQRPHGSTLELLCRAFGMTDDALGYPRAGELLPSVVTLTADQVALLLSILGDGPMTFDPSKRETILRLLTMAGTAAVAPQLFTNSEAWARLATGRPADMNQASIKHFDQLLGTCWEMSNTGELGVADQVLSQFLPRLVTLAPYQAPVAALASSGLQLKSILAAHSLKLSEKVALCGQAVEHARGADDPNVLVAGLAQQAVAYRYAGQIDTAHQTYQEALRYTPHLAPLLRSRVYAESASILATYGRGREAQFYLEMAYESFPAAPADDPSYLYADCPYAVLVLYEGQAYLDLDRPDTAWASFEKLQGPASAETPERIRLEVVNHQGRAAIALGDLEKYAWCLETGLTGAQRLGSQKRFDEAVSIYRQDLPAAWKHEAKITTLAERFQL